MFNFYEIQRPNKWILILFVVFINSPFLFALVWQVALGKPFGNNPMCNVGLFISLGVCIIITLLFISIKLETKVTKTGLYYRFFPFQPSFRHLPFEAIKSLQIRKYDALTEFGGWGMRFTLGNKSGYIIGGEIGLELVTNTGKKILIGTRKAEELTKALQKFNLAIK